MKTCARGGEPAVGAESDGPNGLVVLQGCGEEASRFNVPELRGAVVAAGQHAAAIGRKSHVPDIFLMLETVLYAAGAHIPQLSHAVDAPRYNRFSVRAELC